MSEKKSVGRMIWPATTRAGRRRLTEEEERLWAVVARSIKPLRAGKRVPMAAVPKLSPPKLSPQSARPVSKIGVFTTRGGVMRGLRSVSSS